MTSAGTLFDRLDDEWPTVVRRATAAGVPARWAEEDEALAPFAGGLDLLLAATEDRATSAEEKDRVLVALARRAASEEVAVRTLVQVLLPGAKALAGRLGWMGPAEVCAGLVVAELWARVRTFPAERCPARVAGRVLADVRKSLLRAEEPRRRSDGTRHLTASGHIVELAPMDEVDEADLVADAGRGRVGAEELLAVLNDAVASGHLTARAARLIAATRIYDVSCAEVAVAEGVEVQSIRQRRRRAELALAAAVRLAA